MVRVLAKDEEFQISFFRKRYETKELKEKNPLYNLKNKLITSIVKNSLVELIVSAACVGVACMFIATPMAALTLVASSVAVLFVSVLLRSVASFAGYRETILKLKNSHEASQKQKAYSYLKSFTQMIAPWGYADVIDKNTRDVLVHEAGHAIAAKLLVKNPESTISIVPFKGGSTSYRLGALTNIGNFFGKAKTKAIISAAGPFAAVATSSFAFGLSYTLDKKKPELSRYMRRCAIESIGNQAFYALSALWVNPLTNSGHDFLKLWASGIHPLVSVVCTVAVPVLIKIGLTIRDKIKLRHIKKIATLEAKRNYNAYSIKNPSALTKQENALIDSKVYYKSYPIRSFL